MKPLTIDQHLGSLLPEGVPPGSEIQEATGDLCRPCVRADRPARQTGNSSPASGRGPSNHCPRTVRTCAEGTAAGSRYSDWRPKSCQHLDPLDPPYGSVSPDPSLGASVLSGAGPYGVVLSHILLLFSASRQAWRSFPRHYIYNLPL